ncbi:MBL fold metallo-hydrolase [Phascolarctobacterium succinatutens]|mgnify:FL=1|uniref:MBL fold metallo-hydrolase n=1 Tax=Phascolarctobacterium succinatutens TaxID=626940 RepID=UPI0026EEC0AD|nr:MBL fold metallo-hydrolase [Phascolarctobacterium succinatutens]
MLNDFQIVMLASGSKGNAALISTAKQRFLVDIGISCRALTTRMKEIGVSVNELDGVFITHEHVDHVRGLATFLKNYQVPVYSSALTWRAILAKDSSLVRQNCRLIDNNRLLCGDLEVQSFSIPHDAVDPHGYTFTSRSNGSKCTYLTDAGFVTDTIREAVAGSSALVLEANHDVEMLKNGSYPRHLKQRILSTLGHLSNDTAGHFLTELERLPEHIVLAHLSEHNNLPQLAQDTVQNILQDNNRLQETELFVAAQNRVVADSPLPAVLDLK